MVNGEAVSPSSQLRLRLELAGVIRETAKGIVVTPEGRRLAGQEPEASTTSAAAKASFALDKRGFASGPGCHCPSSQV
jgi:hypothetical protein